MEEKKEKTEENEITETTEDAASDLQLDTSKLLNQKQNQKESVTDKYGIDVFSNEYEAVVEQMESQRISEENQLREQIFANKLKEVSANDVSKELFHEIHKDFDNDIAEDTARNFIGFEMAVAFACLLFFCLLIIRIKKGKKYERHNTENDHRTEIKY